MDDLGNVGTAVTDGAAVETADTGAAVETTETPISTPPPVSDDLPQPATPETPEGAEAEAGDEGSEEAELSGGGDASPAELKIRKDIAELKKTNPEAAKQWAKEHYSLGAYQKEFGTVQEARGAKATIDSLGGEEGINALQDEVGDFRKEIAQFRDGDPALLQDLYANSPESTINAAQNLMDMLMEKNGEHFDQAVIPAMYARLDGGGAYKAMARIDATLDVIQKAIEEGDGQKAYDIMQQLRNPEVTDSFAQMKAWFGHLKNLAQKNGEKQQKSKVDPEREAFDRERQEFAEQKAKEVDTRIGEGVTKLNNTSMSKLTDTFFKDIKLPPVGRAKFLKNLESEIYAAMRKDKTYQRQANNKKSKGDNEATIRFMNAKFAELLPHHFRELRNSLYPNWKPGQATPPAKPNANGTAATNGARTATTQASGAVTKPNREDVDWNKTDQLNWISGKGIVLKNGKTVNLDWKAVRV